VHLNGILVVMDGTMEWKELRQKRDGVMGLTVEYILCYVPKVMFKNQISHITICLFYLTSSTILDKILRADQKKFQDLKYCGDQQNM
jgi:hypothetical protein